MSAFQFKGDIQASKSLLNRALIIKSHFKNFNIYGQSQCDDVQLMETAVNNLSMGKTQFHCGAAGTVLRFLALRLARETGEFLLTGSAALYQRLPADLIQVLSQLGVDVKLTPEGFRLRSQGWKVMGDALHLQSKKSSQFASAVFLNAWNYPFDLFVTVPQSMASMAYFQMTLSQLSNLGMVINSKKTEYYIPKNQTLLIDSYICEPDMGSVFAVAAAAVLAGDATFLNFSSQSLQPDVSFLDVFNQMQIPYSITGSSLHIAQQSSFNSVHLNINNTPDLFPVLSVLCSFANGESTLFGAPHLVDKESNRIATTVELLTQAGVRFEERPDGLKIQGNPHLSPTSFDFDCRKDHRLAMAAGLLQLKGFKINIHKKSDVDKSFPKFWEIIATPNKFNKQGSPR